MFRIDHNAMRSCVDTDESRGRHHQSSFLHYLTHTALRGAFTRFHTTAWKAPLVIVYAASHQQSLSLDSSKIAAAQPTLSPTVLPILSSSIILVISSSPLSVCHLDASQSCGGLSLSQTVANPTRRQIRKHQVKDNEPARRWKQEGICDAPRKEEESDD